MMFVVETILKNLVYIVLLGIALGLLFDIITFMTLLNPYSYMKVLLVFKDISICLLFTLAQILIVYYCNNGNFRGLYALTLFVSVIITHAFCKKLWIKLLKRIKLEKYTSFL